MRSASLMFVVAVACPVITHADAPEWTRDIAPIFDRCCIACHDGTGPGAYPLRTAREVAAKRETVLKALELRVMPPFLPSLDSAVVRPPTPTDEERQRIREWCEAGCPEGTPSAPLAAKPHASTSIQSVRMGDGWTILAIDQRGMRSFQVPLQSEAEQLVGGFRVTYDKPGLVSRLNFNVAPTEVAAALDERDSAVGFRLTGDAGESPAGSMGGCGINGLFELPAGYAFSIPSHSSLIAEAHADGRGRTEIGGFDVHLLAPHRVDGKTPLVVRASIIGNQGAETATLDGITAMLRSAPSEDGLDAVAIVLRPGMYALSAEVMVQRPSDVAPQCVVRIPSYDIHVDRPYMLSPPLRVPAGSRWTLTTTHPFASKARLAIPQAVLIGVVEEPTAAEKTEDRAGVAMTLPESLDASVRSWLESRIVSTTADGSFEVTSEITPSAVKALLNADADGSTGGSAGCGVTWYEAVELCNAMSARMGLTPRYDMQSVYRENGVLRGAIVHEVPGNGWRLPRESEWKQLAAQAKLADFSGSVWDWSQDREGEQRVVLGGCWADQVESRGIDARSAIYPSTRSELFGMRMIRPLAITNTHPSHP
ncbi:MAG: hypothetical protein O2800_07710 [Planctomycetota bacterium]|nr:hypothetical protein [Planctomycetota bacterium]